MADVITRFRLETTQYDSKLRDAANSLSEFARNAAKAGKDFDTLTQSNVEAARAFGSIATTSTNAKEKVRELVGAYNEVARAYNNLTQEQQGGDFGQALSQSMTELKQRITDAKQELYSAGNSMKETSQDGDALGGILEQVAGKIGISTSALGPLGAALAATTGALKVAHDAFFASEAKVDEWGRIMQSSQSVYESFLNALNNSDFGGFLTRIEGVIKAARAAYDELDRLGTLKTIQAPQISAQQTENQRLRDMIRNRRYIAPQDGRAPSPGLKDGQLLTDNQVRTLEKQLQNGTQKLVTLMSNEVHQTTRAIDAQYVSQAKDLGMSIKEFRKGTSSMEVFESMVEGANKYQRWQDEHSYVNQQTGQLIAPRTGNPYEQYKGWQNFRVDGERYNGMVQLIQQRDQQLSQVYSTMSQSYRTINRAEGITSRVGGGGKSGGAGASTSKGGGTTHTTPTTPTYVPVQGSIDAQQALVQSLQKKWKAAADDDSRATIKAQIDEATKALDKMQGKVADAPVGSMKYYQDWLKELQQKQQEVTIRNDWEFYAGQIDFVTTKMKELRGEIEIKPAEGSMRALADELKELQEEQQYAASTEEWEKYEEKIEGVTEKMKKLRGEMGDTMSSSVISEKIEKMQKSLNMENIGSDEYTKTYSNIIDATTFQNLITETANRGISMASLGIDNEALWNTILNGDNVPDEYWQRMVELINTKLAEMELDPLQLDFASGNVTEVKRDKGDDAIMKSSKALAGLGSIKGGLEAIGVKIPSGIDKALTVMQGVITAIQGVQTVISIFSTTSQTANTIATTANTAALSAVAVALWANTATSVIPFANGGVVPHAANGGIIPPSSGGTPHFANGGVITNNTQHFANGGVVYGNSYQHSNGGNTQHFAEGGVITNNTHHFAEGGVVNNNIQHFADGGVVIDDNRRFFKSGNISHFANGGIVSNIQHFADGGVIVGINPTTWLHAASGNYVPGRKFSSDLTPIMANAGELILNRAQQGNIASQLEGNMFDNLVLETSISGEDLRILLNTESRRRGRGKYLTTKG